MIGAALPLSLLLATAAAPQPHVRATVPAAAHADAVALTFDEALARAERLPAAAAARAGLAERRSFDEAISGLGNPVVSVSAGGRTLPGETVFTGELTAIQPIPLSARGSAARDAAAAERAAVEAEVRGMLLAARTEAADAWCALRGAEGALEAAAGEERLADDLVARAERAAAAEVVTAAELADLHAWRAEVRLARIQLEADVHERGVALGRALRAPQAVHVRAAGELPEVALPDPAARESLLDAAGALPPAALPAARLRATRAELREQAADATPWLGVGASVVQDQPGERAYFGVLSFELPIFRRGQRERARLVTEVARGEADVSEARSAAAQLASEALHDVERTADALAVLEGTLLPRARDAARLHQLALESREGTAVEFLAARRTLLQAEARARLAAAEHAAARYRLALLLAAVASDGAGVTP